MGTPNFSVPALKFLLSNSLIRDTECLNECMKQKYKVKAIKGVKVIFNKIIGMKSAIKINGSSSDLWLLVSSKRNAIYPIKTTQSNPER